MSLECDNYVFQRLFFNNNKKSVKNLVTLAPSLGLEIRNTILKLSKTIPPLIQEGYRYRVGNILISFNFSGDLFVWEMILVDPLRTPMRMFWLCGTFSWSLDLFFCRGCHRFLCVAPVQALKVAHCLGLSHISW